MIEISNFKERRISPQQVRYLYDQLEWWPNREIEQIQSVLDQGLAFGAWKQGKLVGFCRAVSDGVFRAYIEDVAVLPEYRNKGVGHQLMQQLMEALPDIEVVSLFCSENLMGFYGGHNFKPTKQVVMHAKK